MRMVGSILELQHNCKIQSYRDPFTAGWRHPSDPVDAPDVSLFFLLHMDRNKQTTSSGKGEKFNGAKFCVMVLL